MRRWLIVDTQLACQVQPTYLLSITNSGKIAATTVSITIATRCALHSVEDRQSSILAAPPGNRVLRTVPVYQRMQCIDMKQLPGIISSILLSSLPRIMITSSGVGSGGVEAGKPSRGKRIRSISSITLREVCGVRVRVSM